MKKCNVCKEIKSLDYFYIQRINKKTGTITYQYFCKQCNAKKSSDHYKKTFHGNDAEKWKEKRKNRRQTKQSKDWYVRYRLQTRFGLTVEEFNEKKKEQNNKCYLCNRKNSKKELCIDHNHNTGKIRKLLCHRCNTTLGLVDENITLLKNMIIYLETENDKI